MRRDSSLGRDNALVQSFAAVRAAFVDPEEFWSSPLYRHLSAVVASDPYLIELAAHAREGQVPTFAFFGAVHALLLGGAEHPLADHYPSLRGDGARSPDGSGAALQSFAHVHESDIVEIVSTRLVQTNQVQRTVGLRLALAAIAPSLGSRPAHLLEIGSSAGLLMRQAHYGYRLGGRQFGDRSSPVQLETEWRSELPAPDLDAIPTIASTTGIDLHPLDPAIDADRAWLEALVWPEDRDKAALLHAALTLAATVPVDVIAGAAQDACSVWSRRIPHGDPRIVFHSATRMHVPLDQRADFDRAIDDLGMDGPIFHIAIEGAGIQISEPGKPAIRHFDNDGHLAWVIPEQSGD